MWVSAQGCGVPKYVALWALLLQAPLCLSLSPTAVPVSLFWAAGHLKLSFKLQHYMGLVAASEGTHCMGMAGT